MAVQARYDGHADWYDTRFRILADEQGSAGLLARILGPADPHDPVCVDIGCGTGLHFHAMQTSGYTLIGIDLSADQLDGEVRISAGYGDERRQHDPTGKFPLRSHVGVRYLTMTTFLSAFLAQPTLRLSKVEELDTRMQPWQPDSADGRVIPWNIAITAQAISPPSD